MAEESKPDVLIPSEDTVIVTMVGIRRLEPHHVSTYNSYLQGALDGIRQALAQNRLDLVVWKNVFQQIGVDTLHLLDMSETPLSWRRFATLLKKKHEAYGAEPIRSWGELGVTIRIDSKFKRYLNLTKVNPGTDQHDESVFDTLQDIIGYCVLGILYTRTKETK